MDDAAENMKTAITETTVNRINEEEFANFTSQNKEVVQH